MKTTIVFFNTDGDVIWSDSWIPEQGDAFYGSQLGVPPGATEFRLLWSDETKNVQWSFNAGDALTPGLSTVRNDTDKAEIVEHRAEWDACKRKTDEPSAE